ncbi:12681_t:CDS:2, partial [Entrophospora sp. SA101]
MRLGEIEQVLERYNNHFGRISSEFDSINESITTFQNLFNQRHAIIQRIEQDQQSEMNLSEDSSNSHNSSINSYSPNSSASSSEPLDILCGASAVYLTIENDTLPPLENVRDIVDRAVNSSLLKIEENERKTKVLEVLSQVSGYISVRGLKAFNVLNMERELPLDYTREKIEENIINLKYKLEHPRSEVDINLYGSLRQALENINSSELTWRDPEASMVLSDDSDIVKNLQPRQKNVFLEPRENMKCIIPESIKAKCNEFVSGFNNSNTLHDTRNIFHDKSWKESESKLMEITGRILSTLGEIWSNPAFTSSVSRSEQSPDDFPEVELSESTITPIPSAHISKSSGLGDLPKTQGFNSDFSDNDEVNNWSATYSDNDDEAG